MNKKTVEGHFYIYLFFHSYLNMNIYSKASQKAPFRIQGQDDRYRITEL